MFLSDGTLNSRGFHSRISRRKSCPKKLIDFERRFKFRNMLRTNPLTCILECKTKFETNNADKNKIIFDKLKCMLWTSYIRSLNIDCYFIFIYEIYVLYSIRNSCFSNSKIFLVFIPKSTNLSGIFMDGYFFQIKFNYSEFFWNKI